MIEQQLEFSASRGWGKPTESVQHEASDEALVQSDVASA